MLDFNTQISRRFVRWLGVTLATALLATPVMAERIKDVADVAGVRANQLVGYGLVVGLDGSGDQTSQAPFTTQSLKNMLTQLGVALPPGVNPQISNVAAVTLQGDLPPFAKPGQRIDVTVSSIGNAKSLRGGALLLAPMKGVDGKVYALAQGNLVVSGFGAGGADGSRLTVNVPSSGRVPNGAIIERAAPDGFAGGDSVVLNLHTPDFTTAHRLALCIESTMGAGVATALDATSVRVRAPLDSGARISFVSVLENLELIPGEAPARVIINARTGTVVIGSHVRVGEAAVAHGSLIVSIREDLIVSQPNEFSGGETVVVPSSEIEITEEGKRMFKFESGVNLDDIIRVVNEVGAAPGDLVAILQALKQAGALRAELIVI